MLKEQSVAGEVLLLAHLDDLTDPDVLPSPFEESHLTDDLDFAVVFLPVAFMASPVLDKVLDHRNGHDNRQWQEHGRFTLTDRDLRNYLQYSDQ